MNSENQGKSLYELVLLFTKEASLIFFLLKKNIKLSIIVSLIGGVIGFSYAFFSKPVYKVELSFLVPTNVGSNMLSGFSGLSSLLDNGTNIGTSLNRIDNSSLDRMESKGIDFFERVRFGYLEIAKLYSERCKIIDCRNKDIKTIHKKVLELFNSHILKGV